MGLYLKREPRWIDYSLNIMHIDKLPSELQFTLAWTQYASYLTVVSYKPRISQVHKYGGNTVTSRTAKQLLTTKLSRTNGD